MVEVMRMTCGKVGFCVEIKCIVVVVFDRNISLIDGFHRIRET